MTGPTFEPSRLRLARELREWSQSELATRLGVTAAAISQFESGTTAPSNDTLLRLTTVLEVPLPFMTQPLVETHDGFFRSLRRTPVTKRRRARAVAHVAHDLASNDAVAARLPAPCVPRDCRVDVDASRELVEEMAARIRSMWRVPRGPIANVVALLEQQGILVIRLPMDASDVDAFSLPFADRPVVVLAMDKNDRARSRFDAAHELGHLVLHGDAIWGLKEVERQAHWFAAAFLMPAEDIRDDLPSRLDWPALFELKRRWHVSLAALLMRAKTLEVLSEQQYLNAVKTLSARGWRRVEPVPLGAPEVPATIEVVLNDAPDVQLWPRSVIAGLRSANAAA